MTEDQSRDWRIHRAVDGTPPDHCAICGQRIKKVSGGSGPTWVHSDSGAVVAPNPPGVTTENVGRFKDTPLNEIMEIDHVVRVHRDGQITTGSIGAPIEPDVMDGELVSKDGPWSLMRGYSGQQSNDRSRNAVLHNSESIGAGLERDIRSRPGVYVALAMHWSPGPGEEDDEDRDDVEGWVVAYIQDEGARAMTTINTRKRTRYLHWRAAEHYVQRPMGQADAGGTVDVKLSDSLEPDRLAILTLPDDEAVRLAARIAHLVGYRLIKVEANR